MKHSHRFRFIFFLLLFFFVTLTSQRGRIPAQGRGAPHPSHGASMKQSQDFDSSQQNKCKMVNGVNSCDQASNSTGFKFNYLLLSGVLLIVGFLYMKKREIWILKDIYKKQMSTFESKVLDTPCKMKQADLNNKILAFQNTKFQMDDIRKDKIQHYKCQMRIVNIEKVKERIYEVKYECQDINGESHLQGLVGIYSQNQFGVKLVKVYRKFTEMGERTKKIKNLMFYEGKGTLKELNGQWHFIGYEDTETHSGTWKMIAV